MSEVTFTVDVEDPRPRGSRHPATFGSATDMLLTTLARNRVHGTFFVVGELATVAPSLLRRIAAAGHEIALHSLDHQPLTRLTPKQFARDTRRAKSMLEEVCGCHVVGYRAPVFSLVPESVWVTPILTELGFSYSSSVLPAKNPLFGFPGAPRMPFRWPDGLLELPAPIARFGPLELPFLGGIYLRYLPLGFVRKQLAAVSEPGAWSYCHPYDVDVKQPFFVMRDTAVWVSFLLWLRRGGTLARLNGLLSEFRPEPASHNVTAFGRPFAEQIDAGVFGDANLFEPVPIAGAAGRGT